MIAVNHAVTATLSTTLQISVPAMVVTSDQTIHSALLANLASTSMVEPVRAVKSNSALTALCQLLESATSACHHSFSVMTKNVDALLVQLTTRLPTLVLSQEPAPMVTTIPETINALSVPRHPSVQDALRPPVLAISAHLVCTSLLVLPCAFQEVHELRNQK